mgnify:FL=1
MTRLQHQGAGAPGIDLETQVLAGIIASPARVAIPTLEILETSDFEHWVNQEIFSTLSTVNFADHPEPGSVLVQVSQALLRAGKFVDRDNGLRSTVESLAGVEGHPEQLTYFVTALLEQRFRRDSEMLAHRIISHAQNSPLGDLNRALASVKDLRCLFQRIPQPAHLKPVGGAA